MTMIKTPISDTINKVKEVARIFKSKKLLIDNPEIIENLQSIKSVLEILPDIKTIGGESKINPFLEHKDLAARIAEISGDNYYSKSFISKQDKKDQLVKQFNNTGIFRQMAKYLEENWVTIQNHVDNLCDKNTISSDVKEIFAVRAIFSDTNKDKIVKIFRDLDADIVDNRMEYAKRIGIGEHFKSAILDR